MARSKLASIVVLNLNGRRHLPALLAHLAQQTVREFELILIDNGSQDDSRLLVSQTCRSYDLDLNLICNPQNLGFAAACNQGLRVAKADSIVMLNNDTLPAPTWLEELLSAAHAEPKVGMIASKMLKAHRPEQIDSAGIAVDWTGIAWDRQGGERDDPHESGLSEIFGPCGGAGLYARQMMLDLGGFDEEFFAYMEDVDLAWRARLAGWRCLYQPRARVLHAHSATLGDTSPVKRFLLGRNKVWLVAKNMPTPWLLRLWPMIVGYDTLAVGYGVAQRGDFASLRGRLAGIRGLRQMWPKRHAVQASIADIENWRRFMSPLIAPWAVRDRYSHLKPSA